METHAIVVTQGMLRPQGLNFAKALEEVRQCGAARVKSFLTREAQRELLLALEKVAYQRAPEQVGDVRQDFDQLILRSGAEPPDAGLAPILALAAEYTAFIRDQAESLNQAWLAGFAPTDISLQRYLPGSQGITPHLDSRRFVKLISVVSLGGTAEFRLCRDRQGSLLRRYQLAPGDLLLLRAPGFAGVRSARPLHCVSGPRADVRYSIAFRMGRQAEAGWEQAPAGSD